MPTINSHTQLQEILQLAQKQYQEVRWRLNFLATLGSEEAKELGEEQIVDWYQSIWKQHLN